MDSKNVCYYVGTFAPPTKSHAKTALWLSNRPSITGVAVVLGNDNIDEVTIEQKKKLWEILLHAYPMSKVTITEAPDEKSITYVYNTLCKNPEAECFIALDEKTARGKNFNTHFAPFLNCNIELIDSQYKKESEKLLEYIRTGNKNGFKTLMPDTFTPDHVQEAWEVFQNKNESVKDKYEGMFDNNYWKKALQLDSPQDMSMKEVKVKEKAPKSGHVPKLKPGLAMNPKDADRKELKMGIKDEMEHTDDKWTAMKIALDHLKEDPHYYSKMKKAGIV